MKYWTSEGIGLLDKKIDAYERRIGTYPDLRAADRFTRNTYNEGTDEETELNLQEGIDITQLSAMVAERNQLMPAPTPANNRKVQTGHQVTILYLVDSVRKKMGQFESFIVGGDGESNMDRDTEVHTISCTSPMGRALVGKCVGDEVTYQTPNGGVMEVEITQIALPSVGPLFEAANAA